MNHHDTVATYLRMLADQIEQRRVVGLEFGWQGGATMQSELRLCTPLQRVSETITLPDPTRSERIRSDLTGPAQTLEEALRRAPNVHDAPGPDPEPMF